MMKYQTLLAIALCAPSLNAALGFDVLSISDRELSFTLSGTLDSGPVSNADFLFIESTSNADWIKINQPHPTKIINAGWTGEPYETNIQSVVATDQSGSRGSAMIDILFMSDLTSDLIGNGSEINITLPANWSFSPQAGDTLALTWGYEDIFSDPLVGTLQATSSVPEPSTYGFALGVLVIGITAIVKKRIRD